MSIRERLNNYISQPCAPLVAVAVLYGAVQLIVVTTRMRLGWDETVYVSQVSPHVATEYFSAPRARGITLLPAPLVAVTSALGPLRAYMTVLSSAGLVIAYWPWTRLLRPVTVALAALLLTVLWVMQFYGNEVMPNIYVAYGSVAAAGWLVHAVRGTERRPLLWLGLSVGVVALMRPGDALWLALPLVAALAFVKRRRLVTLAAIAAGGVAGSVEWIIEACVRFGDPMRRLHASSENEGGLGWHPEGIRMHLHALNDYLLCRPCNGATWQVPTVSLWWPLIPVLAAGGVAVAARAGRLRLLALPALCGAALGTSYLLLVGYAAPRFLIPAYALIALPVAELMMGVATLGRGRWRLATAATVVAAVVLQATGQQQVLARMVTRQHKSRHELVVLANRLHALGVRPPCALSGDEAPPLAFYAGCSSTQAFGNDKSTDMNGLLQQASTTRFAVLERMSPRPEFTRDWTEYQTVTSAGHHWHIFIPPLPPAAPRN